MTVTADPQRDTDPAGSSDQPGFGTPPGMSRERRLALNTYIRQLADAMRLQAWDIEVGDKEPEDPGAVLATDPQLHRMWAPIYVRSVPTSELDTPFWGETPFEQRQDVVHELVHVITTAQWLWVLNGSWRQQLGHREYELVEEVYRGHHEASTDWLARLIAPSLPMPPEWPDA